MFKNYLLVSIRNFQKNKFYTSINIAGLTIGISCSLLVLIFVLDELVYDKFHSKADRIHRVIGILELEGQGEQSSSCPFPIGPTLYNDYSHLIEHSVRFFNFQDPHHTLKYEEKKFNENGIFLADSNVFEVFDFPLIGGDRKSVLDAPNSIVLNQQLAKKYFGDENPVGKNIQFDGGQLLKVTGILGEIPSQSHIHFDALISFSSILKVWPNIHKNWVWNPNWTYVLLKPGVKPQDLEKEFPAFVQKYYPDFLKPQVVHLLQPLTDIHLHSKYSYEIEANGDYSNLYIFGAIGIFILLIACINFMNLSTARSANRAKEVGIRKVIGANKSQLVKQFLFESFLLTSVATIFAIVLAELLLPFFNEISGKSLKLNLFDQSYLILFIIVITVFTSLLSGIYPSFFLSSFQPVKVLKGSFSSGSRNANLRKTLVISQFAVTVVLIAGTVIIFKQLSFLQSAALGFEKESVIMLPLRPPMAKIFEPLIQKIEVQKGVIGVGAMNDVVGKHHNVHEYNFEGMEKGKWIYFPSLLVNESFIPTMKMELVAGRNFSKEFKRDDSLSVIINEAMVKHMGWESPEKAIGQQFFTPQGDEKIIGVVKNFNYVSLLSPVEPFVLDMPHRLQKNFWTRYYAVRLAEGNHKETINNIERIWKELTNEFPFEFFYLNDNLNTQYVAQENLKKLLTYFSLLAVFIATMGLLALAAYTSEQKTKEIGIRKVLGASHYSIIQLLSKDFLLLVLIGNILAWPIAYFLMKNWLTGFAFSIKIPFDLFIYILFSTIIFTLVVLVFQANRAAKANPVNALKYE